MKKLRGGSLIAPPDFYRQVLKIAVPICLQQLLNQGAGFVDTLMVSYIGYVSIPSLQLTLPVMADWSYPKLKIAPCRYCGSVYTRDLVLMAHNYEKHFGGLSRLRGGEAVTFTDVHGVTTEFTVVFVDILNPTDVEKMTSGEYDLTLFTCTYGGKTRVTVRCQQNS